MNETLESLAREHVGDGRSTLVFLTESGTVRAVFDAGAHNTPGRVATLAGIIEYARTYENCSPIVVEDCTGVAWENEMSEQIHAADGDDLGSP